MEGRAATAPAKYASLIFLLNTPLDVARMGRLPVCSFCSFELNSDLKPSDINYVPRQR
jgi:hypothetical protein